ncbi:MAG: autotransporter domain-containing protein [Sphingomonas sp.]|uniref:autotransporter domain-containing protein n=1 Tax=Sphingomonas sp. TaxID=28214 RepID=UPI003F7D4367
MNASAALGSLIIAASAHAQTANATATGPTGNYYARQDATSVAPPETSIREPEVVISQPGNPNSSTPPNGALDANDVTGIGEMIIDQQNGFIGLCTGTLINPRTVIFAAHCVNENPDETGFQDPWGYGAANGGRPIAFGFRANNNAAGNSAFGNWLFGGYKTDVANYLYNVNQVVYNPASTQLGVSNNFLQGDVAMATLDTPAANVPTWAILLSQLPAPGSIDANQGTGYHVTITGYGDSGTGNTGDTRAVDYRRRVAENYIGLLGSLDDVDGFLFGVNDGLPQNLYQLDFDDPRRGQLNASIYDFNLFKDNALPKEGITAPGDSGGPLILDEAYSEKLVIGVLSGGSRYFNAQRPASYGTSAFYQPLYLYWDWIAANNNYHYVGSKAGDANWTDPSHWVTNIDPSYMTIEGGNLVNGIPTSLGDGVNGTSGKFGSICIEQGGNSDCYNTTTGVETYNGVDYQFTPAGGQPGMLPIPDPTLDNGLPGATNFVPNDRDPDAATHTRAAYFDVTLGAAGTTTLDTNVTVDRLSVVGSGARLNIANGGSLTSLIDVTQANGRITVDGTMNSVGDYLLFSGALDGHGRINTPFMTSVTGMIAPGTAGSIGTLTVGGNLILSSGNVLLVDLGANGTSDKLAVVANQFSAPGVAVDGLASVGGTVLFSPVSGYMIRAGDTYQILTAQNQLAGTFNTVPLSAILTPTFLYSANDVKVKIVAGSYAGVVSANSPVQTAYAKLLDGDRAGSYNMLAGLYGPLDLQNQATIRSTLESWAPRTETLKTALGTAATDNMARFYRDRLEMLGNNDVGGTVAIIGQPLSVTANLNNVGPMGSYEPGAAGTPQVTNVSTGKVPDDVSVFFAGGYLNGNSAPMATAIPAGGRDTFDGWYGAAGIEKQVSSAFKLGFALSYTSAQGTATTGATAKGDLYQGTLYGKLDLSHGAGMDGVFSAGLFDTHMVRSASLIGTPYTLRSNDQSLAVSGELGLSWMADLNGLKLGPRAAIRYSDIGFSDTAEDGGPMALRIDRKGVHSTQGRLGLVLGGAKGKVRPYLTGYYVHDFGNQPGSFGANFVGGVGPAAQFALAGRDKDWWEVSGGLGIDMKNVTLSVGADTTIDRTDVKNQSYRGTITFRF